MTFNSSISCPIENLKLMSPVKLLTQGSESTHLTISIYRYIQGLTIAWDKRCHSQVCLFMSSCFPISFSFCVLNSLTRLLNSTQDNTSNCLCLFSHPPSPTFLFNKYILSLSPPIYNRVHATVSSSLGSYSRCSPTSPTLQGPTPGSMLSALTILKSSFFIYAFDSHLYFIFSSSFIDI